MKSYLTLVPISAKVHRRRNRMTLLCIIIAVFLVTAIFSMADIVVRLEKTRLIDRHGNWHIILQNVSESDAEQIGSGLNVAAESRYGVINYEAEEDYYIGDRKTVLFGVDKTFITDISDCLAEGDYPRNEEEILISSNAKDMFGVNIGDKISVNTPCGSMDYTISGFCEADTLNDLYDAISVYMDMTAFDKTYSLNYNENYSPVYYIQFNQITNVRKAIEAIKEQYGVTDENILENTALLGISGFSRNSTMLNLYLTAAVLFVLILIAGILMITGSLNSNIAERSQFFGMMRCIGASKQQIVRFVRLEALSWCKTAVPAGIVLGILITWGLCAALRFGVGGEWSDITLFGVSAVGIISGIVVGIITVLIAAQSPARRAAKVSPVTAVSGNTESAKYVHHAANIRLAKIETALGVHHAISAKKNLILMTGSFALSIILFLGFSTCLDFARAILPNLRTWTPDLVITSEDGSCSVDRELVDELNSMSGVKRVFDNMYAGDIPVVSDKNIDSVALVSYEEYLLSCAEDDVLSGDLSKVYGDSNYVLTVYNKVNPLTLNDKIQLGDTELEVAAVLSDGLFSDDIILICSEETFTRLTGERNYAMVNIQVTDNATEEDINAIRGLAGSEYRVTDQRELNREAVSTYWVFRLVVYGFLVIIAMISVLNIVNSISMSVSAKIRQYGAMRAVGMDGMQLTKMISAEVLTYALSGCVVGCVFGLLCSSFLYSHLITPYFGILWSVPVIRLGVIILIILAAAVAAIYTPSKRIRNMAVTDTINEL